MTSVGDSKYEVPSALLNPDSVHQTVSCPAETPGTVSRQYVGVTVCACDCMCVCVCDCVPLLLQCWCVPAFMSERIISSMGSRRNDR